MDYDTLSRAADAALRDAPCDVSESDLMRLVCQRVRTVAVETYPGAQVDVDVVSPYRGWLRVGVYTYNAVTEIFGQTVWEVQYDPRMI